MRICIEYRLLEIATWKNDQFDGPHNPSFISPVTHKVEHTKSLNLGRRPRSEIILGVLVLFIILRHINS